MARSVSLSPRDPTRPNSTTDDLDDRIVDGIESLRQRIVTAIRFRLREWFLARNQGLDYNLLIGHRISPGLAASVLNALIRREGGSEVTGLTDIQFSLDRPNRIFNYSVRVQTIYGDMNLSQSLETG